MAEETVTDTGNEGVTPEAVAEGDNTTNVENDGGNAVNNTEPQESSKGEETQEANPETPAFNFDAIKLPDGMTVSDESKAQLGKDMARFGITTQEGLQAFLDWAVEKQDEAYEMFEARDKESQAEDAKKWEEIKSGWKTSLQGDAVFGKDYDANIKRAQDMMDRFGGTELTEWLKAADFYEHPAVLKTFARIGKEIEDAKLITGTKATETTSRPRDRYNRPMLVYKN